MTSEAEPLLVGERDAIEAGIADPIDWGPALCMSTDVARLSQASVLWINRRWFVDRGLDVVDAASRIRLEAWLLREFAWRTTAPDEVSSASPLGADRYGATGRVAHGGSGRAVLSGRFQVKGIGMTPLVGRGADWFHSHGCLWMEEAIREAIFSELFGLEMGEGAVPTIAILDTGLNLAHANGSFGERRALSIRPFVPRLSHLQRAFGYVPLSEQVRTASNRVQREDVYRVRCAWRSYGRACDAGTLPRLPELFERIGAQAAFCHVWKLSHGGFYASNITLDGQLIDFGSATALADWRPRPVSQVGAWFGAERENVVNIAQSICFHALRFARARAQPSANVLVQSFDAGYAAAHRRHLAHHCGRSTRENIASLDDAVLVGRHNAPRAQPLRKVGSHRASPRFNAYRQTLQESLFEEVVRQRGIQPPTAVQVESFVSRHLSQALRTFPMWPDLGDVVVQATDGATTMVIDRCQDEPAQLRIDAPLREGRALIFGSWHCLSTLVAGKETDRRWEARVTLGPDFAVEDPISVDRVLGALLI